MSNPLTKEINKIFYGKSVKDLSNQLNQNYNTHEYTIGRLQSIIRNRAIHDSRFISIEKLRTTRGPKLKCLKTVQ